MNTFRRLPWIAALTFTISMALHAAKIGDPAAPLKVAGWVKGEAVDLSKKGEAQVHVVEFWATWCGPCRTSIPHLTELQKRFGKRVTIIGISDEDAETVEPFVKKMGESMDYTIAVDPERVVYDAYMKAYAQRGIPTAFVVNQTGQIAWVGHPMADLDVVIENVLAGKHDLIAAQKEFEGRASLAERQREVTQLFGQYVGELNEGTKEDASKAGEELLKAVGSDPKMLNLVAWTLMTSDGIAHRDIEFALRVAKEALDQTDGKNADIVDTYARGLFELGRIEAAIEHQKKAIELATSAEMKSDLEATLKEYQDKLKP